MVVFRPTTPMSVPCRFHGVIVLRQDDWSITLSTRLVLFCTRHGAHRLCPGTCRLSWCQGSRPFQALTLSLLSCLLRQVYTLSEAHRQYSEQSVSQGVKAEGPFKIELQGSVETVVAINTKSPVLSCAERVLRWTVGWFRRCRGMHISLFRGDLPPATLPSCFFNDATGVVPVVSGTAPFFK